MNLDEVSLKSKRVFESVLQSLGSNLCVISREAGAQLHSSSFPLSTLRWNFAGVLFFSVTLYTTKHSWVFLEAVCESVSRGRDCRSWVMDKICRMGLLLEKKREKSVNANSGNITMFDVKTYCRHSRMHTYCAVNQIFVMIIV